MKNPETILFGVLNWGMGHATRSAVYIQQLLNEGHTVYIASDGKPLHWLAKRFPQCTALSLPSYEVRYQKEGGSLALHMVKEAPRLLGIIKREHQVTQAYVAKYAIHRIISDNRYGLYSSEVPSHLLSHQLYLHTPYKLTDFLVNAYYKRAILPFDKWLVPDYLPPNNLTGKLSSRVERPKEYIGPLSRLRIPENKEKTYDICVLLSGPEPQRSILEKKLYAILAPTGYRIQFICGAPPAEASQSTRELSIMGFVEDEVLNQIIGGSKIVICRSGYSTIMDLHSFTGHKLLIPTPGQTEQEYLAKRLTEREDRTIVIKQGELAKKLASILAKLLSRPTA